MNEEIDDTEFFHQDFTTASEWEIFIARVEEVINQWKTDDLKNDETNDSKNIWMTRSEKITFVDFDFNLIHYRKKLDNDELSESSDDRQNKNPIDTLHDFELFDENNYIQDSCLSIWYGLNEFIVIKPFNDSGLTSESRIKMLLSSLYIAASNTKCEIPMFVQIRDKWQKCYLGVYEGDEIRTNFEMIHLRRGPPHCQYLNGLLDLFKSKIMSPITLDPIIVSVQLTYTLTNFGTYTWHQDFTSRKDEDLGKISLSNLLFGVTIDPIQSILLKTTWSHLPDNLIVDTEGYSDFDPFHAPKWSCLVNLTAEPICLLGDSLSEISSLNLTAEPICLLGDSLSEISSLLTSSTSVYDILGDFAQAPIPDSNPLDLLTEPAMPTISTLLTRAARTSITKLKRGGVPPINEEVLVQLLYYLFPDADENLTTPYGSKDSERDKSVAPQDSSDEPVMNLEQECRGFKTAGVDSLVWRLSLVLLHALESLGGSKALAHVWYEFVQEMRYRWEKTMPIPGLNSGYPDLRTCLLNQKLQMLNCCIEIKRARENQTSTSTFDSAENSSSDDEEFYDCSEKPEEERKKHKYSLWNQPVGRLGKFGNLKLLETGDPLYIPITQELVPKTEDQLEEDTNVLLQLGSDAEASELRAKMMSASLLSDMESFKAANPGSIVKDFIRWYSPRDWIEEEELDEWGQNKGSLSPRMLIDNNIWVQMWESAKPVPANRQKRLFDDTREAEKVLQFLDYRNVGQICELIIPTLSHAVIYKLVEESQHVDTAASDISTKLTNLIKYIERITRESKPTLRRFEAFIQEVSLVELLISQVNSLMYKFNPTGTTDLGLSNLIGNLVTGKETVLQNGSNSIIGSRIVAMFAEAQKTAHMILGEQNEEETGRSPQGNNSLPMPCEREFVMRVSAPKPARYSAKCPQFLRAVLTKNSFRLAGAFSEDTVFF